MPAVSDAIFTISAEPSQASTSNPFEKKYLLSLPEPHPRSRIRAPGARYPRNRSWICVNSTSAVSFVNFPAFRS